MHDYMYIIQYMYRTPSLSISAYFISHVIVYCQTCWQPCGKHPCREDQEITLFRFQCLEEMSGVDWMDGCLTCIKLHEYIYTSGSCGVDASLRQKFREKSYYHLPWDVEQNPKISNGNLCTVFQPCQMVWFGILSTASNNDYCTGSN